MASKLFAKQGFNNTSIIQSMIAAKFIRGTFKYTLFLTNLWKTILMRIMITRVIIFLFSYWQKNNDGGKRH